MTGNVSTCQALTVVSAPEDIHSIQMDGAVKVSAVLICAIYCSI